MCLQAFQVGGSLMYPCKPDGFLCICCNAKDLNKSIVWEHYNAPTLEEISHCLNGATCFSKLDAMDSFWSIHLHEKSSYLTTLNIHHGRYRFLCIPFGLKMSQEIFQMCMDQIVVHVLTLSPFTMIYASTATLLRSITGTSWSSCRQQPSMVLSSIA